MKFPTVPGTTFKFTAASAAEAAELLRAQLGDGASVLSVRQVARSGLLGIFSPPRLEVIARVGGGEAADEARGGGRGPRGSETTLAADPLPAVGLARRAPRQARGLEPAETAGRDSVGQVHNLAQLLARSGFSPAVIDRLRASPEWEALRSEPLHRALVHTGRVLTRLATGSRPDPAPLSRLAFLGAPGAGRTTALCKWTAAEVFRRARIGHVVRVELHRSNPAGPLPVFCEALGVPLAPHPASTRPATPGGFVCVDLPGMSVRHPAENAPLRTFLDREEISARVLVLNAAYAPAALAAACAAGRDLGATHVVFSHLDEVAQWGRLWDHLLEGDLIPLFLSTGPSLTGELEADPVDAIARRTFPADAGEIAVGDFGGRRTGDRGRPSEVGHHLNETDANETELSSAFRPPSSAAATAA
jgi:flagellar biosynthesis protein FlhF